LVKQKEEKKNMNARLYDPVIGRFFSPDKYVANSSFTQDFNRYSYARNNPLHYVDPSGHKMKWWQGLLIVLGVDALAGGAISSAIITTGITLAPMMTEQSYELQKFISPVAVKFSFGFGDRNHIGIDASFGMLKGSGYRWHGGASYYGGKNVYGGYKGWETRTGAELSIGNISISGTTFKAGEFSQTLNRITLGNPFVNVSYENDYLFGLGAPLGRYNADGGDRWRTAAVGMNFGPLNVNLNMFTGDPGLDGDYRQENVAMINGHLTYTGGTANKYRAGVLSFGFGPIRIGRNSEQIRLIFQNKLAHDILNG
jgi:RHS repeat-associated protein